MMGVRGDSANVRRRRKRLEGDALALAPVRQEHDGIGSAYAPARLVAVELLGLLGGYTDNDVGLDRPEGDDGRRAGERSERADRNVERR